MLNVKIENSHEIHRLFFRSFASASNWICFQISVSSGFIGKRIYSPFSTRLIFPASAPAIKGSTYILVSAEFIFFQLSSSVKRPFFQSMLFRGRASFSGLCSTVGGPLFPVSALAVRGLLLMLDPQPSLCSLCDEKSKFH